MGGYIGLRRGEAASGKGNLPENQNAPVERGQASSIGAPSVIGLTRPCSGPVKRKRKQLHVGH